MTEYVSYVKQEAPILVEGQIDFKTLLNGVKSYDEIAARVGKAIAEAEMQGSRIGFVSASLGNGKTPFYDDWKNLRERTQKLRELYHFPIFSCTDIFDHAWNNLEEESFLKRDFSRKMSDQER